jgi:hypothetical protein
MALKSSGFQGGSISIPKSGTADASVSGLPLKDDAGYANPFGSPERSPGCYGCASRHVIGAVYALHRRAVLAEAKLLALTRGKKM